MLNNAIIDESPESGALTLKLNDGYEAKQMPLMGLSGRSVHYPAIIEDILSPLKDEQAELALITSLSLMSGFFPKATYRDNSKHQCLCLYTLIIMPPASGKNIINSVAKITEHTQRQLKAVKGSVRVFNSGETSMASQAVSPDLIVASNITSSKLIEKLYHNNGHPLLMVETELDTLTNASRGENGRQLSAILRKAAEQETISQERRRNGEELIVSEPKLAAVLSGTPGQLFTMFNDGGDGLLSRFILFKGTGTNSWVSSRPSVNKSEPLDSYYRRLGIGFYDLYMRFRETEINVEFSSIQWDRVDSTGMKWQALLVRDGDFNARSIIRRACNHVLKIASMLTVLRNVDAMNPSEKVNLICEETDLLLAISMMEVFIDNSIEFHHELKQRHVEGYKPTLPKDKILARLPKTFRRSEAASVAKKEGVAARTMDRYLHQMVTDNQIKLIGHGQYEKFN